MRVLVCGTTYYPALNGQSVFTVNLAEGLARAGHEVVVLFPEERSTARVRNRVRLEAAGALSLWFIHKDTFVPVAFGKVRRLFDEPDPGSGTVRVMAVSKFPCRQIPGWFFCRRPES